MSFFFAVILESSRFLGTTTRLHCAEGKESSRSSGNLIKIKGMKKESQEYVRRNHVLNIKQLMNNKKVPFITFYARLRSIS